MGIDARAPLVIDVAGSGKPSTREEGEGRTKRLVYDDIRPDGAAAVKLINDLKAAKTESMPAPWRQTAGSGGSEFGKVAWYKTLKSAFPSSSSPPEFRLWQLALADHVVRSALFIMHTNLFAATTTPITSPLADGDTSIPEQQKGSRLA